MRFSQVNGKNQRQKYIIGSDLKKMWGWDGKGKGRERDLKGKSRETDFNN